MTELKITADPFPYKIKILFCESKTELVEYINNSHDRQGAARYEEKDIDGIDAGFFPPYNNAAAIIWMPQKPQSVKEFISLVHETFHATAHCMSLHGVIYCDQSEEAFAYMQTSLLDKIVAAAEID